MDQIKGQVAIVAGGGSGLGEGIARRFANEGALVMIVDPVDGAADKVAVSIGKSAMAVCADMRDEETPRRVAQLAVDSHGRIDILVNAQFPPSQVACPETMDLARFRSLIDSTAIAALGASQAVYPQMRRQGGGRIINVGSPYGATAHEAISDAVTADGALIALTRALGYEWARHNILVNFLQAGAADIPAFHDWRDQQEGDRVDRLIAAKPMPRLADPVGDIGGAAMFLVSDEGCFIVGHRIMADGGQHLSAAVFEPGTKP